LNKTERSKKKKKHLVEAGLGESETLEKQGAKGGTKNARLIVIRKSKQGGKKGGNGS